MTTPAPRAHGRFITLEGGEGSGKSTLARALEEQLTERGHHVTRTREPGGSPGAELIRALVLHPAHEGGFSPRAEALLMSAARAEHIARTIRPALADGHVVICDRFADSTRVYQGASDALTDAELSALEHFTVGDMRPDLTLLLDGSPEAFLARRIARAGAADRFERQDLAFHAAIRAGFLSIAARHPERVVVIDAAQSAEAVLNAALMALADRLLLA